MHIDKTDFQHMELRAYVSPTASKINTILRLADEMRFTKAFPPKRRTIKAYYESLKRYEKQQRREIAMSFKMTLPEYERLQAKAVAMLADFHTGHSMGCDKYIFINGRRFAHVDATDEYAKSCTWRPTHGSFKIELSKSALKGLKRIDGVWTYKGRKLVSSGRKQGYRVDLK